MLTQTSELCIRVLLFLGLRGPSQAPIPPREIANQIDTSPTYTAKVCGQLVRLEILRSQRGANGGVVLARQPSELTLLEIVECAQGKILPDYCQEVTDKRQACAYHVAMSELHAAIVGVLKRWTLHDLMARPHPTRRAAVEGHCLITKNWKSLQAYLDSIRD